MDFNAVHFKPLQVIKSLYDEQPELLHNLNEVGKYFRVVLNTDLSKIPCINHVPLDQIRAESLVCYRGMIQDMFDPEFYLGKYEVTNKLNKNKTQRLGCYTDCSEKQDDVIDFQSANNITLQRQTFYCIPVPGENKWVKDLYYKNYLHEVSACSQSLNQNKRQYCDVEEDESMEEEKMKDNSKTQGLIVEKKAKIDEKAANDNGTSNIVKKPSALDFTKNFPLPGEDGLPCFIKMYGDHGDLKMNDVVEFICILSVDPVFAANTMGTDECGHNTSLGLSDHNSMEEMAHCPPPSLVPRLHCLFYNKLISLQPSLQVKDAAYNDILKELSSIRSDLLKLLSKLVAGDDVVAEYLLFYLISSVYGRVGTMCVGKMSLNVMKCPSGEYASKLYRFIQNIVEKSYYLPLNLENLNNTRFVPRKDYYANRLVSGQLQLPSNLHLVLDETKMQSGKLDSDGVLNITAIGNMIQWQKVEYDFKFSKIEMDVNVNVLVLSEGKSMLKCDCHVPIASSKTPSTTNMDDIISGLSQKVLKKIRLYLSVVRVMEYNLTDEIQAALQDDFVEMRKEDSKVSADSFYLLLTTARYMALSFGENTLSSQLWTRTKQLDAERRKRIIQ